MELLGLHFNGSEGEGLAPRQVTVIPASSADKWRHWQLSLSLSFLMITRGSSMFWLRTPGAGLRGEAWGPTWPSSGRGAWAHTWPLSGPWRCSTPSPSSTNRVSGWGGVQIRVVVVVVFVGILPLSPIPTEAHDWRLCLSAQGIVHRDVRPANIIITRGTAKLTGFGCATAKSDPEALTYHPCPTEFSPPEVRHL
jgi:hypothetical protein